VRAALLVLACAACGPKVGPNGVTSDDAILIVKSNVRDAQVYLDGRFVASLEALGGGVAIAPGVHRMELRHDDFFSGYLELDLKRAERRKVTLALAPVLP
jgi:hypothetical protein